MGTLRVWAVAMLLAAPVTASLAQGDNTPASAMEKQSPPQSNASGTAPGDRGSTGWTGGNREQTGSATIGQNPAQSAAEAKDQPPMATGADLNGPPARFPANKTPE